MTRWGGIDVDRGRHARTALAVSVVLAALAIATTTTAGFSGVSDAPAIEGALAAPAPSSIGTGGAPSDASWSVLVAGLAAGEEPMVLAVGTSLVIVRGERTAMPGRLLIDVVDLGTGASTALPPVLDPNALPTGMVSFAGQAVVSLASGTVISVDPAARTIAAFDAPPQQALILRNSLVEVPDGFIDFSRLARFDLATLAWSPVPAPPAVRNAGLYSRTAVASGTTAYLTGRGVETLAYDTVTGAWAILPPPRTTGTTGSPAARATTNGFVLVDEGGETDRWDATAQRWTPEAAAPWPPTAAECQPDAAPGQGAVVLVQCGQVLRFDGSWSELTPGVQSVRAATVSVDDVYALVEPARGRASLDVVRLGS